MLIGQYIIMKSFISIASWLELSVYSLFRLSAYKLALQMTSVSEVFLAGLGTMKFYFFLQFLNVVTWTSSFCRKIPPIIYHYRWEYSFKKIIAATAAVVVVPLVVVLLRSRAKEIRVEWNESKKDSIIIYQLVLPTTN